ncbi:uncharacterized protein B0H64DRAFT_400073 [Chaetomium fimeti]|uniref:F-box domain-containing protein n=1 Tax=Chaetomium fimeti TaxID=1854472 RepID=A0AAE0LQX9_9PEZI|nr:hypothetical protein B0H64DRAFT_400073 [Chaetomium fimeti]
MSPLIFSCVICGWPIFDEHGSVSWMNEFRGLCSTWQRGVYVSGVGLYSDPQSAAFIAPPDPEGRWDDPGYTSPRRDRLGVLAYGELHGKRGFVFHDACWSLVKQLYHPAPVPLQRLLQVMDSLPKIWTGHSLDWGHDYGGLAILQDQKDYFPWEYLRFTDRDFEGDPHTAYRVNPLAHSEVEGILAEAPQAPPSRDSLLSIESSSSGRDPFVLLPGELCSAIAAYLPTPDVLNARRASRSFWLIFDSQQFWASRFKGKASERSWLFEVAQDLETSGGVGGRDWRWLYHRTLDAHLEPGVRNRKRIWGLVQHVADISTLSWNELPVVLPIPWQTSSLPENISPKRPWISAAGSIRAWGHKFSKLQQACARFKLQRVAMRMDVITQIAASTVRFGGCVYIAGLSLTAANGEVLQLGYKAGGREPSLQLQGAALTGFNLAVGLGGIQALQCVSGSDTERQLSAWLGSPHNVPRTERLRRVITSGQTMVLEVGFDGFRMVSFALCRQPTGPQPKGPPKGPRTDGDEILRDTAIWYPHLPPPDLDLNEDFLVAPDVYRSGFRPLFWTRFGGPGGIYLANLVKINITHVVSRMDFIFNRPGAPTDCRTFGRIHIDNSAEESEDEDDKPIEFPIDGPGGEVIHKIEICQAFFTADWIDREGYLALLKIHTNRGRTCEIGKKPKAGKKPNVEKEFVAAPGTAITGFYGAREIHLRSGITSFGVITEPLLKA